MAAKSDVRIIKLSSIVLVVLFASILGYLWGYLRPTDKITVFLDMNTQYREMILSKISKDSSSLNLDYEDIGLDVGSGSTSRVIKAITKLPTETTLDRLLPAPTIKKGVKKKSGTTDKVPKQETDAVVDWNGVGDASSSVYTAKDLSSTESVTKDAMQKVQDKSQENFWHKIKSFFGFGDDKKNSQEEPPKGAISKADNEPISMEQLTRAVSEGNGRSEKVRVAPAQTTVKGQVGSDKVNKEKVEQSPDSGSKDDDGKQTTPSSQNDELDDIPNLDSLDDDIFDLNV